jgi:putative acetyltransferase
MNLVIRPEVPADISAIYPVNQQAFERDNEAQLVDALRRVGAVILSVVAEMDEKIVGHILFSPVMVTDGEQQWAAVGLGPMAVLPEFHNRGIGSALIHYALDVLKNAGHEVVFVVGHPQYYPRFGFKPAKPYGIRWEVNVPEEVFMVLELRENALAGKSGIVRYHALFPRV